MEFDSTIWTHAGHLFRAFVSKVYLPCCLFWRLICVNSQPHVIAHVESLMRSCSSFRTHIVPFKCGYMNKGSYKAINNS